MKAAILHGVDEPVRMESVEAPVARDGEALVRLRAASLNHRDVWIRKGRYPGLKFPTILGSDGVGRVERVGSPTDAAWVGKDVIIDPSLGWGSSESAQNPKTFSILGLPHDGTFAEYVAVPAENLHKKPVFMSDAEAAALPLAGLTAFRAAISRGLLRPGETVLVTGAGGGTATLAIQIAMAQGAKVFATSGSEEKIEKICSLGVLGGVNYREEGWDKKLKELAEGFDLIVDSAGGPNFLKLVELANPGGRIVFFGATVGDPATLPMRSIFWKQLSLLGTTMGSPSDFASMLKFFEKHKIHPIVDREFLLEEANEAFNWMEQGSQLGNIVLKI